MEEKERKRRMIQQKDLLKHNGEFPNEEAHEKVQEEFMSVIHRKQASEMEEQERQRRISQIAVQEAITSEIDRRVTWVLEEQERRRRLMEEMATDMSEAIQREVHR